MVPCNVAHVAATPNGRACLRIRTKILSSADTAKTSNARPVASTAFSLLYHPNLHDSGLAIAMVANRHETGRSAVRDTDLGSSQGAANNCMVFTEEYRVTVRTKGPWQAAAAANRTVCEPRSRLEGTLSRLKSTRLKSTPDTWFWIEGCGGLAKEPKSLGLL